MEQLFDHSLLRQRRERALARLEPGADFLIRRVAEDMAERLMVVERQFEAPVQVHGGLPLAADLMQATGKTARFSFVDTCPVPAKIPAQQARIAGSGAA
jgi:hypothetical protein